MKKALSIIVILCVVLTAFAACAPKPEKAILGTWECKAGILGISTDLEYTFNEDGSGNMTTELGVGVAMNYIINDTSLTITTDTPLLQKSFTYTYAFDGDMLTLTDSDRTITLTKKAAK